MLHWQIEQVRIHICVPNVKVKMKNYKEYNKYEKCLEPHNILHSHTYCLQEIFIKHYTDSPRPTFPLCCTQMNDPELKRNNTRPTFSTLDFFLHFNLVNKIISFQIRIVFVLIFKSRSGSIQNFSSSKVAFWRFPFNPPL